MKIGQSITYSIEDLTEEEFLFLLNVIEQMQLTDDSTDTARQIHNKFKKLYEEIQQDTKKESIYESTEDLILHEEEACDGCEDQFGPLRDCPLTKERVFLCDKCFNIRKENADVYQR